MTYWPWLVGALVLAGVAIGFLIATGRSLGVSGAVANVIDPSAWRAYRSAAAAREMSDLEAALAAATAAEFGGEDTAEALDATSETAKDLTPNDAAPRLAPSLSPPVQALFLVGLVIGGALSALVRGGFGAASMGVTFSRYFGGGAGAAAVLFVGGVLVGIGTRLAGGCTSGHGLVGCARREPASLVATGVFLGAAVVVAHVLVRVMS